MGKAGEMLIDVRDGDSIEDVQREEQIEELTQTITDLENKNKTLLSQTLLDYVTIKEQKAEIATLTRKNNLLKNANKFLRDRIGMFKRNYIKTVSTKEINLLKRIELKESELRKQSMKQIYWIFSICFVTTFALIAIFG